ncbi:hypothetical protein ABEB36_008245 [Hypothenemus hampei]|uniref:Uncharacterized protein n=1 Tax=Hypothenemus hampei TaxID=57062 RepID=A0ABD1EL82_HYPHA
MITVSIKMTTTHKEIPAKVKNLILAYESQSSCVNLHEEVHLEQRHRSKSIGNVLSYKMFRQPIVEIRNILDIEKELVKLEAHLTYYEVYEKESQVAFQEQLFDILKNIVSFDPEGRESTIQKKKDLIAETQKLARVLNAKLPFDASTSKNIRRSYSSYSRREDLSNLQETRVSSTNLNNGFTKSEDSLDSPQISSLKPEDSTGEDDFNSPEISTEEKVYTHEETGLMPSVSKLKKFFSFRRDEKPVIPSYAGVSRSQSLRVTSSSSSRIVKKDSNINKTIQEGQAPAVVVPEFGFRFSPMPYSEGLGGKTANIAKSKSTSDLKQEAASALSNEIVDDQSEDAFVGLTKDDDDIGQEPPIEHYEEPFMSGKVKLLKQSFESLSVSLNKEEKFEKHVIRKEVTHNGTQHFNDYEVEKPFVVSSGSVDTLKSNFEKLNHIEELYLLEKEPEEANIVPIQNPVLYQIASETDESNTSISFLTLNGTEEQENEDVSRPKYVNSTSIEALKLKFENLSRNNSIETGTDNSVTKVDGECSIESTDISLNDQQDNNSLEKIDDHDDKTQNLLKPINSPVTGVQSYADLEMSGSALEDSYMETIIDEVLNGQSLQDVEDEFEKLVLDPESN